MNNLDKYSIEIDKHSIKMLNISDEEYFSKKYSNYVSNSKLKLINPKEGGSPQLFFEGLHQSYSPSLEFGSAIHELILQPESFKLLNYEFKPSAKLGLFIEELVKCRKNKLKIIESIKIASENSGYYINKMTPKIFRNALQKGLRYYLDLYFDKLKSLDFKQNIILSKSIYNSVVECMDVYHKSYLKRFLHSQNITNTKEQYNELAIFVNLIVTLPENIKITIPFKLKIDNFSVDNDTNTIILNDLKTTSNNMEFFMGEKIFNPETNSYDGFLGSFQKLHYYRQLAAYMYILQSCFNDTYKYYSNILVIESKYPYNMDRIKIQNAYIEKGIKEFKELICRVAFHQYYGTNTEFKY